MICAACSHENSTGAKFCEECGAALARACANCGKELGAKAKFCSECGTPTAAGGADGGGSVPVRSGGGGNPAGSGNVVEHAVTRTARGANAAATRAPSGGTRKILTIVFADLVGSTALHERLDPESARRFVESYYEAMREAVESHGGTVMQLLGDGVMAVFGIPRVAEDDAIRAVRAAAAMQEAFRALADKQRDAVGETGLRVAVNTGEVVVTDESEIIGDPVNVAARLQDQGGDGDVVVGDATARLVESAVTLAPLGSFTLKGRAGAVAAFRVESLERPSGAMTAAFVGREDELARIASVYEEAVEKPATALAVLLGSPGLGKSRLIEEFALRLGETATVVEAHCDEASVATFAPLTTAIRELLVIDADADDEALRAAITGAIAEDSTERTRVATGVAALLAGSPTSPEETFFVVRRFLAALATDRPVVLVIDDLQWAEPLLLDLVEHLVEWGSGVPLLVLIGARPELRDKRSSLATAGGLVAEAVTLAGLDAGAAMRLAANVIGADDLPAVVAAKVLATSEGNPLFVGELVRMLVHEGALKREGDRWTTGTALAALEMPPTIHALLAARIERLQPEDRLVLERAAVVGRNFSRSAVAELLPSDAGDLDARLESLQRSELIERDAGWFLGEPVLRFHHVLIRDAAYRQLLKGMRAELHIRFADWVSARAVDTVEHDETIGWHLEQAHSLLCELGPVDAKGREIGERASNHLAEAGRRALAGDDVSLAASLLGRAIGRLDYEDFARSELALDWCEALLAAGDVGPAMEAIDELQRFVGDSERLRAWHTCFAGQLTVLTAPEGLQETADTVAAAAEALASQEDHAGEAKGHYVYALALARLGKVGACEAALDRALAAARRVSGDRRRANTVLAIAPIAALWGPSPVTRASGRCLDVVRVLRITQGAPAVEAVALSCQGVLEALRGRTDAARRMIESSRKMVEELGVTQRLLEVEVSSGLLDLLEGDAASAERTLRGAYEGMRDLGLGVDAARAAALLARALLAQDRVDDAEKLSHESEALAGDDLKAAIAWRGVRAEALAQRGEHVAAVEFASAAVEIAEATDALLDHADARLALAAALRAAGREREADAEERRAYELWEAKGATLLAERARSDGTGIGSASTEGTRVESTAFAREADAASAGSGRRVRPNAASATTMRFAEKFKAHDLDAVREILSERYQQLDHPTGSTYGRDATLTSVQSLFRSHDPYFEMEMLGTLGVDLALVQRRSGARGSDGPRYDVGAYETEAVHVIEVDENNRLLRTDIFAADRLGEGIACLYGRYAEGLREGVARDRALETARWMTEMFVASNDFDRVAKAVEPDFESVDHRHLSTWTLRGADAWLEHMRALQAVADDVDMRTLDVLALEPSAVLVQRMHAGTERVGGGVYERPFLVIFAADDDGRLTRAEWFDADREEEALARFDELTATAERLPAARRVSSNAATVLCERTTAAVCARDLSEIESVVSETFEYLHHVTGVVFAKPEWIEQVRAATAAERIERRHELLGSLGDRVALGYGWTNLDGMVGEDFESFGPTEVHDVFVFEADVDGHLRRIESFAPERLGNAIVRTYELYADHLPEGEERNRVESTAKVLATFFGPPELDAFLDMVGPEVELVDRRTLGHETLRGPEAVRGYIRALFELENFTIRAGDLLRLEPGMALFRTITLGTARTGGGAYERSMLQVWVFESDGRAARMEHFDVAHEAEALARFDELAGNASTPEPARSVNAAARASEEQMAAWEDKDWERFDQGFSHDFHYSDRRRAIQLELDREKGIEFLRSLGEQAARRAIESDVLATRGDRLVLRSNLIVITDDDVGPSELVHLNLFETDEHGAVKTLIRWDEEDLDAAMAELDGRFAASGEPAKLDRTEPSGTRDAGAMLANPNAASRAMDRWQEAFDAAVKTDDWDAMRNLCAPDCGFDDRRSMSLVSGDLELMIASARERAAMGAKPRRLLVGTAGDRVGIERVLWSGGPADGRFEIEYYGVFEVDESGLISAFVLMDIDDPRAVQREAWARWEAHEPGIMAVISPAATACDAFNAKHAVGWRGVLSDDFVMDDHRLAGIGRIDGPDAYTESIVALWDLAPVTHSELGWVWPAFDHCGGVTVLRRTGTVPDGGGDFESEQVFLFLVEDGLIARTEMFELDALDEALARFEELRADPLRIPPNAAVRSRNRFSRAPLTGEWDAFRDCVSAEFVYEDRGRRALVTGDVETWIASLQYVLALPGVWVRTPLIATVGDRILLDLLDISGSPESGAFEFDRVRLIEVDEKDLVRTSILFDPEDRGAAFTEANARFLAGEAAGYPAQATIQRLLEAWPRRDWAALRDVLAEDIVIDDHRKLSFGRISREEWIESWRVGADLAPDVRGDWVRILEWNEHGRVTLSRVYGTRDGGEFENVFVAVMVADDTAIRHFEFFETEDADRAVARFKELCPGRANDAEIAATHTEPAAPSADTRLMPAFENAATRAVDREAAAVKARAWARWRNLLAPDFRGVDRRAMFAMEGNREEYAESFRQMVEMTTSQTAYRILATRGERLAIVRSFWHGERGDIGPSEIELLYVLEVNDRGEQLAVVAFDPDAFNAAYAELDARYESGEAATLPLSTTAYRRAVERGDWGAVAEMCAPSFVEQDHRALAVLPTAHGGEAWARQDRTLYELAPDTVMRIDHVRWKPRGTLFHVVYEGASEGSAYQIPFVGVLEIDEHGKFLRNDLYDPERIDLALERFAELSDQDLQAPAEREVLHVNPNAVTAAFDRWAAAYDEGAATGDWTAMRDLYAPEMVWEDRQRLSQLSGDRELSIESSRERAAIGARPEWRAVATAGERVAVARVLWTGGPPEGRFELENLAVGEVDASGAVTALILFDPQDIRAAQREAWTRWAAIDPDVAQSLEFITELTDAWNAQDANRLRACMDDDIVVEDHRRAGLGRIEGADAYVQTNVVLWDLAPDQRIEYGLFPLAIGPHGVLATLRRWGTLPHGGEFESVYLTLGIVERGRVTRSEMFETDAFDEALARFDELRPNPLRIPSNTAEQAFGRLSDVTEAGDVDAIESLFALSFVGEDRRRLFRMTLDRETAIANARHISDVGWHRERTLLASAGDRLALLHVLASTGENGATSEVEHLVLIESDHEGRLNSIVSFDPDDRAAAHAELTRRYLENGAEWATGAVEFWRGLNAHDLERARSGLVDEFFLHDHRRTGMGLVEGADAYIASLEALYELTLDVTVQPLWTAANAAYGRVEVLRTTGTNREGGEFETIFISVTTNCGDKLAAFEYFEPEDLDRALARFEELRPDPLRVPPNEVVRAFERLGATEGPDAIRAAVTDDFVFDDRCKRSLVTGGVEEWVRSLEFLREQARGTRPASRLLATGGERIALSQVLWSGGPSEGRFEIEHYVLSEVDESGLIKRLVLFDPDDRPAAHDELFRRYVEHGAGGMPPGQIEFYRGWNAHDMNRILSGVTDDLVLDDRRPTGMGLVEGADAYKRSVEAIYELIPDARIDPLYDAAVTEDGRVSAIYRYGHNSEGGAVESFLAVILLYREGKISRLEFFEIEQLDEAVARFEELTGEHADSRQRA